MWKLRYMIYLIHTKIDINTNDLNVLQKLKLLKIYGKKKPLRKLVLEYFIIADTSRYWDTHIPHGQ